MEASLTRYVAGPSGRVEPAGDGRLRFLLDAFFVVAVLAYALVVALPMRMSVRDLRQEVEDLGTRLERWENGDARPAGPTSMPERSSSPPHLGPEALLPALIEATREANLQLGAVTQAPWRGGGEEPRQAQLRARGSFVQALTLLDALAALGPALEVQTIGLHRAATSSAGPAALEIDLSLALAVRSLGSSPLGKAAEEEQR